MGSPGRVNIMVMVIYMPISCDWHRDDACVSVLSSARHEDINVQLDLWKGKVLRSREEPISLYSLRTHHFLSLLVPFRKEF